MYLNKWKHFHRQVLLLLWHFFLLSHFEIIKCIVKSVIGTSTYFLLKYNWKSKTWKVFFGCQSFGAQTSFLGLPTAWISPWFTTWFDHSCNINVTSQCKEINHLTKLGILILNVNVWFLETFVRTQTYYKEL